MSAGLNTVAGTLYEDFIEGWLPKYTTDGLASLIMKVIVVVMGCICVLFVYIVEHLGGIIEVKFFEQMIISSCKLSKSVHI